MNHIYITLLLLVTAISCGDEEPMHSSSDEQTEEEPDASDCPGHGLQSLCDGECPADHTAAAKRLCGGQLGYAIYENDCGGTTVTDPDTTAFQKMLGAIYLAGTAYYFDAHDKLVGGARWSDAYDPHCPLPPFYGKKCQPSSSGELHRCDE